eukprot:CAMPEP_0113878206 /NCGR_PEP_ID=MMETSP0780_2-20120614/6538_1 /TAXON_ID=652834 /ORGANISM="Palpitomonas bilix" /LENGTH=473 /DNA_ID=CAMNT_0000864619 /DNA_START=300 /DNA_END=1721 /DNA_ORIENTATION=- /assembly_acc=CAM_ASM_000599
MRLGAGAALRQKALIGLKASLSHQQDAESDSASEYRLQYERHIEEARRKGKEWHSPLLGKSSTNNGIRGGKHSEYSSPPKVLARSRQISYPRFASAQESDSDSDSGEGSEERRANNVERRGQKEGREAPLPSLPTLSQIDIGRKGKEGKLQEGSQKQEQGRDETGKRSVKTENKRKGRGKKQVKNGGDSNENSAGLTSWSLPSLGLNLGGSSSVVGGTRGVLPGDSGEGGGNKGRHSGRSHVSDITTASPHRKRHSQKLDHQTMQWLQKRNMRVPLQGQKENAEKRKEYYRQVFMSLGPTDGYLDYRALVAALRAAASKTPQRKELVDLFFRGIGRGGKIDFDQFFKANSRVEKRLKHARSSGDLIGDLYSIMDDETVRTTSIAKEVETFPWDLVKVTYEYKRDLKVVGVPQCNSKALKRLSGAASVLLMAKMWRRNSAASSNISSSDAAPYDRSSFVSSPRLSHVPTGVHDE